MKRNVSVVQFKFRCNILISGEIIKEMPCEVASGTPCIYVSLLFPNLATLKQICPKFLQQMRFAASSEVCPTRYLTLHFFNNSNTNEDIATEFEEEYVRCVRNEEECVCSLHQISLQYPH